MVKHKHPTAQMVEVWTGVLELQVQNTRRATLSTGCDCFPCLFFVRTLLSQYPVETIKTFLYKIERDGFTTQGITQLKKQLTV